MATAQGCKKIRDTERSPMSELTDDLLVDIISRVPFKSTCSCKCVCMRWRDLVSHPDHRKKMPQTVAGIFFYKSHNADHCPSVQSGYQSVSGNWYAGIDTSLSFLPGCKTMNIFLLDCCNGLLLCRQWMGTDKKTGVYVVCNPATKRWVSVPATSWPSEVWFARLAFDPAVSSHFHVFEFAPASVVDANMQDNEYETKAVRIYSSEAGTWTHGIVWDNPALISRFSKGVFLDGLLYLTSYDPFVVAVGMEGNHRAIRVPAAHPFREVQHVYLSKGKLHLANRGDFGLSVWVLDSISENWTLKHNVSHLQLLGTGSGYAENLYKVISIDSESSVILFILYGNGYRPGTKLMSYRMDSNKLSFICDIGWGFVTPNLPYVPLFSKSLADGH